MGHRNNYRFGRFVLFTEDRLLIRDEMPVPMAPRVFAALECLVEARGQLVRKQDLLSFAWPMRFVSDSSLTRAVADLRKALGPDRKIIQTVSGAGYRLLETVVLVENNAVANSERAYPA